MLVFVAFLLSAFIAAAALMIGVAQMQLARTELRSATDAAARAAAQTLATTQDVQLARRAGRRAARINRVNNEPLRLRGRDFEFGRSTMDESGTFVFRANQTPINSVRVLGERSNNSRSGPIPLFMGGIFSAGTFSPSQTATATYIERDIALVVDRSGSMYGRKFRELEEAVQIFTDTLRDTPVEEWIGLASYSSSGRADVEMTDDLGEIDRAIDNMEVGGMTSISDGMRYGREILSRSRSSTYVEKTMIVMTDGMHNRGTAPRYVAEDLAAEGVLIHAITFGSGADRSRMQNIARIDGGRYYHADNGLELQQIYREIALTLSTMLTQ